MGIIKAVLFDMDGVLIEAKDWHYEALNRALGLFGYEITRAEHLSNYDGLKIGVCYKELTNIDIIMDEHDIKFDKVFKW